MHRREFLECLLVLHERKLYHALGFSSTFHYAAHTFGIELSYRCKRWWPTRKQIRRLALAALILVIVGFVGLWILTFYPRRRAPSLSLGSGALFGGGETGWTSTPGSAPAASGGTRSCATCSPTTEQSAPRSGWPGGEAAPDHKSCWKKRAPLY